MARQPATAAPTAQVRIVGWQIALGFFALMAMGACGIIITTLAAVSGTDCFQAGRNAEATSIQPIWRAQDLDDEAPAMAEAVSRLSEWRVTNEPSEWTSVQWLNRGLNRAGDVAFAGGNVIHAQGPLGPCRPVEDRGIVVVLSKRTGEWSAAASRGNDRLLLRCAEVPFRVTPRDPTSVNDFSFVFDRPCVTFQDGTMGAEVTVRVSGDRWAPL